MNCPTCGAAFEAGDAYCVNCGLALSMGDVNPQQHARRRRLPWLAAMLVLLVAGVFGVLWYLDLLPAGLVPTRRAERTAPRQEIVVQTKAPFLILQAYQGNLLEVFAVDLEGRLLASLGTSDDRASPVPAATTLPFTSWGGLTTTTGPGAAAWAWPDGRALVSLHNDDGWDLLTYDAERGEIRELVRAVQSLVVQGSASAANFLVRYESADAPGLLAGGEEIDEAIALLSDADALGEVALSPDGRQAVYQSDDIFIVDTSGQKTHRRRGELSSFVFSPDSRYLYFASGPQLIRADADGRNARILAEVGRNDRIWPVSASDSYVAVQQHLGGANDLSVISSAGEMVSRTGRSQSPYLAHYLPDKLGLLLAVEDNNQWQLELADMKGEDRRVLAEELDDFWVLPAPDSRSLVLAGLRDDFWNLTIYDLRQNERQELAHDPYRVWPLAANTDFVVMAAQDEAGWSLLALSLRDNEITELDSGAARGYPVAYFLPDGDGLIYEAADDMVVRETAQPEGQVSVEMMFGGGIFRVDFRNPTPVAVYENASLLAASLAK